jgi:hypothetical protein
VGIKVILEDGHGTGHTHKVNGEGEAGVVVHPHPPINEEVTVLPFRQYFTADGTADGSNDWVVDGSSTNQDFYIKADPLVDIYINSISVIIGDGGSPNLNGYGALSALTNGVEWIYFTQDEGEYQLHDGIKSNLEFIRIGVNTGAIGDSTTAYLADVSGGGTEKSYMPIIDISESFGMPWGVRLVKGTTDKIVFRIKDDLTGLITHNAIAYGIRQRESAKQ